MTSGGCSQIAFYGDVSSSPVTLPANGRFSGHVSIGTTATAVKAGEVAVGDRFDTGGAQYSVESAPVYTDSSGNCTIPNLPQSDANRLRFVIVELMWEGGIAKQRWSVSDTAEYGDYVSGPRVIDPSVKEHMKAVLAGIQSGAFAERFIADQDAGAPEFLALRAKGAAHPIEETGKELRALFAWKQQDADYTEGSAAR